MDLGQEHILRFTCWMCDRDLNPQYANLPDVEKYGAIIEHSNCEGGAITFAGPVQESLEPDRPKWTVESWEPLTLSPSLLCHCGDHGFIREGKWVIA